MDDCSTQDERLMTVITAALKLSAEEREPFLRAACGSDIRLFEEAAEAIEWENRMSGFLQHPMIVVREPDSPFVSGETISLRFEIIRKLGEGGMGIVYEAFDRKRNQKIAIKSAKPGFGRMLSPELEGALKVRHPNVCLVNEIHSTQTAQGDVDFLTMELLDGETLSAKLSREGKLPAGDAEEIARQLCSGLKEAHRSGVIHRDLKAGNVIVCRQADGSLRAVITDFGLSGEAARPGFFGTQRYMAPELLLGQKATKASDIYALGVILYEMSGSAEPAQASRTYQRLVAEFLSLQPERRSQAFDTAVQSLSRHAFSRRQILSIGTGVAVTLATGGWWERDRIANWLQPLPQKRFVALLAWPPDANQQMKSLIGGAIDAIENELARAEAADRNLFVTSARSVSIDGHENGWLGKLGESLGVNLALQASGIQMPQGFALLLKLFDISTGAVLRQHQIICSAKEITELSIKAVQSAARLLDVRWDEQDSGRIKVTTDSVVAFQAFQIAEDLKQRPNDEGLLAAIDSYKKAIDTDPKYAAAYARLAMAYIRLNAINLDLGVLELARANAAKAIQLDEKTANGRLALAMVYSGKGDLDAAISQIRAATELDPANHRVLSWQGQIYIQAHRWKEAEQAYLRLQKERPNYWVSYNDLGFVLTSVGRYREGIEQFRIAAAAAPHSTMALSNLGWFNFKVGNLKQAEETDRRSLAIRPDAITFMNLGEVLRVRGKFRDALVYCKKAVELRPSDDQTWLGLADCYEAMGGQEKEARETFERAVVEAERQLQTDSSDGAVWIRLALYRMKRHAVSEAWLSVKRSEEHGPLDIDSDLLKMRVFELAGRRKEALDIAASCLRRAPVDFQIKTVRDLGSLTKDPGYSRIVKLAASSGSASHPIV